MSIIPLKTFARINVAAATIFLSFLIYGCASSTKLTASWKSPNASRPYSKIIVVALTNNLLARQEVEHDLQEQLRHRGIEAARSIDIYPPTKGTGSEGMDLDLLKEKLHGQQYDGILTAALIDEKTETRYVPGYYDYGYYYPMAGPYWYGWYGGYYSYWYPILYQPGYYTMDKIYFLETNLYDVETEQLAWSAQSKSYSPSNLRKAANKFAEITVDRMVQDKVISARK
jgi:hypothetical protein